MGQLNNNLAGSKSVHVVSPNVGLYLHDGVFHHTTAQFPAYSHQIIQHLNRCHAACPMHTRLGWDYCRECGRISTLKGRPGVLKY